MNILQQYNSALRITTCPAVQRKVFDSNPSITAFDTETTGVVFHSPSYLHTSSADILYDNPVVFGISLAIPYRNRIALFWGRLGTPLFDECVKLLVREDKKTTHNARYDIRVCEENGIPVAPTVDDTLTMSRIYWDRRKKHSLQSLTEVLCPEISGWEVAVKKEWKRLKAYYTRKRKKEGLPYFKDYANYSFIPDELMAPYAMTDAFMHLMLYCFLEPKVSNDFHELYEREIKVMHIVSGIEKRGLPFDAKKARRKARIPLKLMAECKETMLSLAGPEFTFHPPKIVKALHRLGLHSSKLKLKGKITTVADVLNRELAKGVFDEVKTFIDALLLYRFHKKTVDTYLLPLAKRAEYSNGIIHTTINPTDSRTGRPASSKPNIFNITRPEDDDSGREVPVRSCFICRKGYTVYYFDIDQQEVAYFALLAGDQRLLDAYADGVDLHQFMSDITGLSRVDTKGTTFGITYGQGIRAMALIRKITQEEAQQNMDIYMRELPFVRRFQDECKRELRVKGYVDDFFGRCYHIPYGQAYIAVNALVQGGCAQAFKIGLINTASILKRNEYIISLPYDELQIERPTKRKGEQSFISDVCEALSNVPQLTERDLRLRVSVSKSTTNWAEKEKVKL